MVLVLTSNLAKNDLRAHTVEAREKGAIHSILDMAALSLSLFDLESKYGLYFRQVVPQGIHFCILEK